MAIISAQFLEYWDTVNHWKATPTLVIQDSANQTLYFQLVQLVGASPTSSSSCGGVDLFPRDCAAQRYIPGGSGGSNATGSISWSGVISGNISLVLAGTTFTQAFSVDNNTTVGLLAAQLNSSSIAQKLVASVATGGSIAFTSSLGAAGNSLPFLGATSLSGVVSPSVLTYLTGGSGWPGAAIRVRFLNINDANVVERWASVASPADPSIWSVPLFMTDPIHGTVVVEFTIFDSLGQTTFKVQNSLRTNISTSPCF